MKIRMEQAGLQNFSGKMHEIIQKNSRFPRQFHISPVKIVAYRFPIRKCAGNQQTAGGGFAQRQMLH